MIKIAVFGHEPIDFRNIDSTMRDINDSIEIIRRENNNERDIVFNVNGEPGTSQWFCGVLRDDNIQYEMYLSSIPETQCQYWLDSQKECFMDQLNWAHGVHIYFTNNKEESNVGRDKKMIDDAQWVLVFWNGKHQGSTYNAMKYALRNNKLVYNGIGGLKIVDLDDLITE